ncbi:selenide, water dikinase SelD [Alloalcanivorax mobilis]|uniref:selenide, water dikinase SelD n=1 Tax=Alloalcanivorax mobilis TaxID=2019569 RepID=UPI000C762333|nr:selenide, water dikinase SelD [Alloalcanivorax mobilis]
MTSGGAEHDLLLAGGGHSHALLLRRLAMKPIPGLRVTLVSPESLSAYSGMLPGLIAGHYSLTQTHIDLPRLCQASGARFVRARVTGVDPRRRFVHLHDGGTLDYDWLSLDVGATPDLERVPGAATEAVAVKPVSAFHQRWHALLEKLSRQPGEPALAVVGGGAGGTEMALAVRQALRRRGLNARIDLITAGELLPGYPPAVRRRIGRRLEDAAIQLHPHSPVRRVEAHTLKLPDRGLTFDFLLWCTGARAPAWLADSGLSCDEQGFVRVNETLQSIDDLRVFASGDCAAFPTPLPKAGVYAVRQADTLAANLRAVVGGQPLRRFKPQRRYLSLLSGGNRDAVGSRGPGPTVSGTWVWRWKDRIDRAFMAKFDQRLPAMPMANDNLTTQPMHCAGCGAKVGATALQEALAELRPVARDNSDAGLGEADDAAVIRWPGERRLVQSLDYFPAFIDDPYLFGRIAALHSLSDLYAMNADPHSALANVCLAHNHPRLQGRDLKRLMAGAVRELNQANCSLVGGHTIEGPQLAAGFTVNGSALPEQLWHKSGARPGDRLIVTKALGTGVQLAAAMQGLTRGPWLDAALENMLASNGNARDALRRFHPGACTDITGFGLLGHLLEICEQSGCDARLDLDTLPLLPGTLELIERGVGSTLKPANDQVLARCQRPRVADHDPRLAAATDPQTSGGLLFCLAEEHLSEALAALRQAGVPACVAGAITVKNHKAFSTLTLVPTAP